MSAFSLSGRMRRRTFGFNVIGNFIAGIGLGMFGGLGQIMADATQGKVPSFELLYQPRWLFFAVSLLLTLAMAFAFIKRLNDLQWPTWLGYLYGAVSSASLAYTYMNFNAAMAASGNPTKMGPVDIFISVFGFVSLVFFLVLIFKRGTVGPNANGADPSV